MVQGSPLMPSQAMRRLVEFLKESKSRLVPADMAAEAIDDWIARKRGLLPDIMPDHMPGLTPGRKAGLTQDQIAAAPNGYRWRSLFLPDGTRLRMDCRGESFDALVLDGELRFRGSRISPRQMTIAVAGKGYNAWRALWILLPGAQRWKQACRLRDEARQSGPQPPLPPYEAMAAAAACMADTLRSALALVDHSARQAQPPLERRQERHRRETDYLLDSFMND